MCKLDWSLLLEFLKVFASGPPVAAIASIVIITTFRKEIKGLFDRLAHVRWGGAEVSIGPAQAQGAPQASVTEAGGILQSESIAKGGQESERSDAISMAPAADVVPASMLHAAESAATYWEFNYLNFFLVPKTQRVLEWFADQLLPMHVNLIEYVWVRAIPNEIERANTWNALQQHRLIEARNDGLVISQRGREYLSWRQPISAQWYPTYEQILSSVAPPLPPLPIARSDGSIS